MNFRVFLILLLVVISLFSCSDNKKHIGKWKVTHNSSRKIDSAFVICKNDSICLEKIDENGNKKGRCFSYDIDYSKDSIEIVVGIFILVADFHNNDEVTVYDKGREKSFIKIKRIE